MSESALYAFEVLPRINFTPWHSWAGRLHIPGRERPGLYLIGFSEDSLEGRQADPVGREVVEIGQTAKQTLRKHLGNFDRSVFRGEMGLHSAGETFRRTCPLEEKALWVAVFAPTDLPMNVVGPFIRYAERKLLLDYVLRWGKLPVCNIE